MTFYQADKMLSMADGKVNILWSGYFPTSGLNRGNDCFVSLPPELICYVEDFVPFDELVSFDFLHLLSIHLHYFHMKSYFLMVVLKELLAYKDLPFCIFVV